LRQIARTWGVAEREPAALIQTPTHIKQFMKIISTLFLQAFVCLTARAADTDVPAWAMKVFNERLSSRYELVQEMEPSFYVGDFNGDGKSDVALLITERTTGKVGIAIVEGAEGATKIIGAGKSFGNGGDDFSWMDAWSLRHSGKIDRLYLAKSEAASALIYWDGSKYKWQQEGD